MESALLIRMPLQQGGFGLRTTTPAETDAVLISGADMAQSNVIEGLTACRPYQGLMRTSHMEAWNQVLESVSDESG